MLHTILTALIYPAATQHIGVDPTKEPIGPSATETGTEPFLRPLGTDGQDRHDPHRGPSSRSYSRPVGNEVALHAVGDGGLRARRVHRKVDDLVTALGAEPGISKSEETRIRADLDTDVSAFNTRDLSEQDLPYVLLDATC